MQSEKFEDKFCEKYEMLPNSAATNAVKMLLSSNNNGDIRPSKDTKFEKKEYYTETEFNFKSRNSQVTITVDRCSEIFSNQDKKTRKIFNFILQQYNEQNKPKEIIFKLKDLVERNIYKNSDSARNGFKTCMKKLMDIKISGIIKRGKKEVASSVQVMFIGFEIINGLCTVTLNEKLDMEFLAQYITIIPRWGYQLNSTAYACIDYIFYRARISVDDIKKKGSFNISLDSISRHIGQPDPRDIEKHAQFIIKPLMNAFKEIEEIQKDMNHIKIVSNYDGNYKNATDFLKGFIKIELSENLNNYFIERSKDKENKIDKTIKNSEIKKDKTVSAVQQTVFVMQ